MPNNQKQLFITLGSWTLGLVALVIAVFAIFQIREISSQISILAGKGAVPSTEGIPRETVLPEVKGTPTPIGEEEIPGISQTPGPQETSTESIPIDSPLNLSESFILHAPGGSCFLVSVENDGSLNTEPISCP